MIHDFRFKGVRKEGRLILKHLMFRTYSTKDPKNYRYNYVTPVNLQLLAT